MSKRAITFVIVAIAVIVGIALIASNSGTGNVATGIGTTSASSASSSDLAAAGAAGSGSSSASTAPSLTSTGQKLADQPFASRAYQIFPGPLSSAAQRALDGFAMQTKDLGNGVTEVDLIAKQQNYQTQTYAVPSGDTLYFIETSHGDDQPSADYSYGDDQGVIVDANGFMMQ
ncbi:MAG: hypothetical protein KGI45_00805 [Patescibacteria group bacterium]|nr:hypothetical protein [Patescibacteria group bacterium]MDE1940820.1 hypothetical protein [Patescibacteria group bacterium]MDE1966597.1 hypothetical protein [Patescibacteria group bacterium]